MLASLMMVTGLKVFEIYVPWMGDMYWDFAIDAPFKIIEEPADAAMI